LSGVRFTAGALFGGYVKSDSFFPSDSNHGCDHSDKYCCCGGHNHSNPKKNLHNHSTRQKFLYRLSRRWKQKLREELINGYI